jgi:hypothetical protein
VKIPGQCKFERKMSEWTGTVVVTVLDLEADFDPILRMCWHRHWAPLMDWDTLDMFVNTSDGAVGIAHKLGIQDFKLPDVQALNSAGRLAGWFET